MKTCGIDLGTTNSCIFVGDWQGNTLIVDEYEHKTFPSIVYVGRDGKPVVGYAARNRIGELPGPVTTIKRKLGSTETVMLGGRQQTPVEVSALILTFLKQLAEKQTGETVDRAVVTVPAYFSHIQRQQTDEAGKLAGFREVTTLLEPVAAALVYSLASEAERLRIFVYDLGGGTFDATVLEKDRYGGINVLSFGGDPFLGGDDVDARLACVLIGKLTERGYNLELDLDQPEDYSRFQRLKAYAELAKKELTDREQFTLVHQGLMEDKSGETIDLDLAVTRAELEDCAHDLIERSIAESIKTLSKNDITISSIDEVIMVGGMSRMPLAQRMLAEAFGREPKVVDPDLIVARGAAIKAAEVYGEQEVAASGLRLELRYDRRTDKEHTRISGLFDRAVTNHTLYLFSDTGELSQTVSGTDRFTFDPVPLQPLKENTFTLSVEDEDEAVIIERAIRITHEAQSGGMLVSPGAVVTKPIQIWTADGLEVLFPENTMLPHSVRHTFETGDQSGQIVAPIWEGNHEVARLEVKDIPRELKVGTPVHIDVSVESDYQISASANVPDIMRKVEVKFRIEPVDTSKITPEHVRQELVRLQQQAAEAAAKCSSEEALELSRFNFRQVQNQIEIELSEPEPKRAKLQEKLSELAALIQKLPRADQPSQLTPTYEEFSERLRGIVNLASDNNHPRLAEMRPQISIVEEKGSVAWQKKDAFAWQQVNKQLDVIGHQLQPEIAPEERAMGIAAWLAAREVPELREAAGRRYADEIHHIENEALTIFLQTQMQLLDAQSAISKLITLFQEHVTPLRARLGLVTESAPRVAADMSDIGGLIRRRQN
jgi:molecular chaperone DnaK (HSP70)